jgi:2Fe-2S ferredoxin
MPEIIFRLADGTEQRVQTTAGTTLMRAANDNGLDGIAADCGGECACATCHVYVDEAFADKLPPLAKAENDMLDFVAAERRPTSRLSCQIRITDAMDGIVLAIPETQF